MTDVTQQMQNENNSDLPTTIPVCVSSCVLGQEVLEVLTKVALDSFFFRDVLQDQSMLSSWQLIDATEWLYGL